MICQFSHFLHLLSTQTLLDPVTLEKNFVWFIFRFQYLVAFEQLLGAKFWTLRNRYIASRKCKECWILWKGNNKIPIAVNPYPPSSILKSWICCENFLVTSCTHKLYRIGQGDSSPGQKGLSHVRFVSWGKWFLFYVSEVCLFTH